MGRDPDRPLRVDAQRNRDKILATAVRVFGQDGLDANFDRIAKEAGVGTGTLYRNFPTREALVEAAYRSELARLCDAAPRLLATLPATAALRAWMGGFIDYAVAKRGMADALRAVVASGGDPYSHTQEMLRASVTSLLAGGIASGSIRDDVCAPDVLAGLTGIALATAGPEQREQAERLLDLMMDGLHHLHQKGKP
ncbi:TetR/AcrR family transcriptional regulator [Pseudonocardia sp. GCM10023141]|uniref:TetR/AcrR family transcriptional regulator n=1 Tax=Pseudonocardia sp. GCM10023141 TaxID=3252653 RepID=UPI00361C83F2